MNNPKKRRYIKIPHKQSKAASFLPHLFADKANVKDLRLFTDVNFSPDKLFGKADAFLEDVDILRSFAVERGDCNNFYDKENSLVLLCAPKGTGKTTLCKLWENELSKLNENVTLMPNYTDMVGLSSNSDFAELSNIWKRKLLSEILSTLIKENSTLVNNIIGQIRLNQRKTKEINICDFFLSSIKTDHETSPKLTAAVSELQKNRDATIWLFLDEFDADFTKELASINKLAALLNAARDLSTEFSNIRIRITIRPNVWATLRSHNSLMSNFKELILNLEWTPTEIRKMLANRIERYIRVHTDFGKLNWETVEFTDKEKDDWLISQIFDTEKFDLGRGNRPPEIVLAKLCADRPRWIIELCKAACGIKNKRTGVILIEDIRKCLREIGASRMADITSEYSIYCPQVNEILNAFYNAKGSYDLVALLSYVEAQVTSKIDVEILGVSKKCNAKQVVNFLYELTFIEPQKLLPKDAEKKYEFLHYKQYPDLLETDIINANVENDLYWKVHPAFKNYLNIGIPSNFELE